MYWKSDEMVTVGWGGRVNRKSDGAAESIGNLTAAILHAISLDSMVRQPFCILFYKILWHRSYFCMRCGSKWSMVRQGGCARLCYFIKSYSTAAIFV